MSLRAAIHVAALLALTVLAQTQATGTAELCAGNVTERMEHHLIQDLRNCVWRTEKEYDRCVHGAGRLFFVMVSRYARCFDEKPYASSSRYSDGTHSDYVFRGWFRGSYRSFHITQLKKQPNERFARDIDALLKELRHQ